MSRTSILVPLAGGPDDATPLRAAASLAARLNAEVSAVYAPPDPAAFMPWSGDNLAGSSQIAAFDTLRLASDEAEVRARAAVAREIKAPARFSRLESPVWSSLCSEARFCDVAIFSEDAATGRGLLGEGFQHVLMDEGRPVFVPRFDASAAVSLDRVAIAWDGGRESTRAVRAAAAWLSLAASITIVVAPEATPHRFDPGRLQAYLQSQGLLATTEVLAGSGEPGHLISEAVARIGADVLIAGAFGHPRFRRFIFGGATKALLSAENGPSLFLVH